MGSVQRKLSAVVVALLATAAIAVALFGRTS
jgi:hypothetical protein